MPKKPARNSYYYFMLEFKEDQRKKGINYANLGEVQQAADPVWRNMTPSQKAKYEEIAKKEKAKYNVPERKYTSTGIPFSEIERQQQLAQEAEETELKDIKNFVKLKGLNKSLLEEDIFLVDVNAYCYANNHYLMGESTVLRFSILDGIKDHYHEAINPGRIPIGYASDVKWGSEELGLEMPDEDSPRTDYMTVLANLIDYLKRQDSSVKTLPPLYTMPEKVQQVQDFIIQMCNRTGEDDSIFRVYKLDTLFFYIINEIKEHQNEGFPKITLATARLKKDPFRYTPGLACERHEKEKPIECTKSRVKRWAFTILDSCCPVAGIDPIPGNHLPIQTDVDTVLQVKEKKKEALGELAPISMTRDADSCNSSVLTQPFTALSVASSGVKKARAPHVPGRMPKKDLSWTVRVAPPAALAPPALSHTDFPTLVAAGGRGRGRGLGASYRSVVSDN